MSVDKDQDQDKNKARTKTKTKTKTKTEPRPQPGLKPRLKKKFLYYLKQWKVRAHWALHPGPKSLICLWKTYTICAKIHT